MAQNISPDALFGTTVYDKDGDKIGKVDEVYLDNASGQPEWVSVKTGLFGSSLSLIPLAQASTSGDSVKVPFAKSVVKDAPHHDPGKELSETDEVDLYRYYDIADTSASAQTSSTQTTGTHNTGIQTTGTGVSGGYNTDRTAGGHDDRAHRDGRRHRPHQRQHCRRFRPRPQPR